jgi:hypothetical protein
VICCCIYSKDQREGEPEKVEVEVVVNLTVCLVIVEQQSNRRCL